MARRFFFLKWQLSSFTPDWSLEQGCRLLFKSSLVFLKKRVDFFKNSRLLSENRHPLNQTTNLGFVFYFPDSYFSWIFFILSNRLL